ncbi:MAG: hypothetical protein ABJM06_03310 [Gilvibacter sp.]
MKKIALIGIAVLALVSCSKDNVAEIAQQTEAQATAIVTDNINAYVGVFTTMDSQYRATVAIDFPTGNTATLTDAVAKAAITLNSGEVFTATAITSAQTKDGIAGLLFTSDKLSFRFSCDKNGENAVITEASFKGLNADILLAANRGAAPPLTILGTYVCLDCGSHPVLGTGATQTFNIILPEGGDINSTAVSTQIILDGNNFGSGSGNEISRTQFIEGYLRNAVIAGGGSIPGISWEGELFKSSALTCEGVTGSWELDSPTYGLLNGTFVSDTRCDFVGALAFNNYDGSGFSPTPTAGQLDSDKIIVSGMSDGSMNYGDTAVTGDFARGFDVGGGVTTGGVYSFEVSAGTRTLGVQPGGSDFTPGYIEYKVRNTTGAPTSSFVIGAAFYVNNDQGRANSFNIQYSTDGTTFTPLSGSTFDYTSVEAADAAGFTFAFGGSTTKNEVVANGDYVYVRILGDDVGGSGSRDEFGLLVVNVLMNN